MVNMISIKDHTYGTRRLKAGDDIENVSGPNARLLKALGRARLIESGEKKTEIKSDVQAHAKAALRDEYERIFGKRPFNGWDAEALRQKIAAGPDQG
jgi:hypothetical protein